MGMAVMMKTKNRKTYKALSRLDSFEERFRYLKLHGNVGRDTFGFDRIFNQQFYTSPEWKRIRHQVIVRDNGCDLGVPGREIHGRILIHHINPLSMDEIEHGDEALLSLDNLVCVSHETHNAIHYGSEKLLPELPTERRKNDTCPWKRLGGDA